MRLRIRCQCGRNLAETQDPLCFDVDPRPGVKQQRDHRPGPFQVTFSWKCPKCGRTPQLTAHRIAEAGRRSAPLPASPRVVVLTIGSDL